MKEIVFLFTLSLATPLAVVAETPDNPSGPGAQIPATQATIDKLLAVIAAHEARIQELEKKELEKKRSLAASAAADPPVADPVAGPPSAAVGQNTTPPPPPEPPIEPTAHSLASARDTAMGGHNMSLPEGPVLNIRGFFDFNFGVGSIANPLVYPIVDDGCGTCGNPFTAAHSAFQAGEFDLFLSSRLSDRLSFIGEVVLGPDATNVFGVDIERYQLTYRANPYLSAAAGRFHTSIGYYNTAYHHGNWFATAEGRPIMYLFEDSGGVLPVHMVGLSFNGDVPHTAALGLHWVAEVGNGSSSNPFASSTVQNFYSDRNYKATNLAAYIRPQFLPGLQIGGSWFHDGLNPSQAENPLAVSELKQNVESAYAVYFSEKWEFMSEGVLLTNRVPATHQTFRSPMTYTQVARGFGMYKPYVRYQYISDSGRDPVNVLKGTYYGPSVGLRIDFANYAAFKLQFNHLSQSSQLAGNGLDAQVGFTF